MRIAFHAPMKSPHDPRVSGDRTVARGLVEAMRMAGHEVEIASRFRSYDRGDPLRQARLAVLGERVGERLVRRQRCAGAAGRYDLWFTYHLYHKAPDLIGPAVSRALAIPYVVAEASVADKQAGGRFDLGYRKSIEALRAADLVIGLNPADAGGVERHRPARTATLALPPFLDTEPFVAASKDRGAARETLVARHGLDTGRPWLVAAAMMRADQKLASYRLMAEALTMLRDERFQLVLVGDGEARGDVEAAFAGLEDRVAFYGAADPLDMPSLFAACDLYAWPAIKEAFGMSLLEAQACGLPVVAGGSVGVANVVEDGVGGCLVPQGNAGAFATAVRSFLRDPSRRQRFGRAAQARTLARHDISAASASLDAALGRTIECRRPSRHPPSRRAAPALTVRSSLEAS